MNGAPFTALLAGLLLSSPLAALGYIPTSALAATERPRHAWPYAVYGACAILLFALCAWPLHLVLLAAGIAWPELPLDILALWGVNRALRALTGRSAVLQAQSPFFALNCAVLGAGLAAVERYPHDWYPALLFAAGMAVGFPAAVIVIAHCRERIETGRFSPRLAGWPSLLLLCACCCVACQGLALLLR
ncbi:MAG TPA: Rnf-Nqr domain containing protein [Candidatus Edwardsbacteria bacterium]|nr:Rnf-Nqr domain containing protein [Candidatus Edwardsbacteria bacterium]